MAFASCKKTDEPIFDNPDVRLNGELTAYQKQLTGAEFGWRGYLLTDREVPATFLFKFDEKNRTTISADYQITPKESSYRLKALQKPTLLFDTYSTIHLLSDPTSSVFGGATGSGYSSDFEFEFISSSPDTIKMEGIFNKSKLILIRAKTANESSNTFTDLNSMITSISKLKTYFKRATIGGLECEINLDGQAQTMSFSYLEGTELKTLKANFYISGSSINFYTPLVIGTETIKELVGVSFNSSTGFIDASLNGAAVEIREAIAPLKYDVDGAKKWYAWAKSSVFVSSALGFHIDGVDDALGLRSLAGFIRIDFIPFTGTNTLDNARIVATTNYGPALATIIDANGIATFQYNNLVFGTTPVAASATVAKYRNQYITPQGYYLIQTKTGNNAQQKWDMVSVSDAKAWISWQF
jgi:hypothetical protein